MLLAASSAHAQRLEPHRFATVPEPFAESAARPSVAEVAFGHPDDYRWEGALIGAITVGVWGAYLAAGMCTYDNPDPTVGCILGHGMLALLVGGVVGGGVGGLLGGLIPKDKP